MSQKESPSRSVTPDQQESVPVTTMVTLHEWTHGTQVWHADILRPFPAAPGHTSVFGSGDANLAFFDATKACVAQMDLFDTAVEPIVTDLPNAGVTSFKFQEACR
jgi:hypothetical protein